MRSYLDFEKPVAELEAKVQELRELTANGDAVAIEDEIARLEAKAQAALKELYAKLTPWQKTQVARHPQRPHFSDYMKRLVEDFTPLAGDRKFAEDAAILGGFGRFRGRSVLILGHEKGSDTQSRIKHNFGMARPEGYRKAVRLLDLAERFGVPVVSLIDTAGAYPGVGAEERGQGGAIAIATANRVLMLEHAIYSVISPEGAASILWRDPTRAQEAATALKITAQDLFKFGIIDAMVPAPVGGAHRDPDATVAAVGDAIERSLTELDNIDAAEARRSRREKFLAIGRTLA